MVPAMALALRLDALVNGHLGHWRRLSRCYEGTEASARAWLEVAAVGYLAWGAVV